MSEVDLTQSAMRTMLPFRYMIRAFLAMALTGCAVEEPTRATARRELGIQAGSTARGGSFGRGDSSAQVRSAMGDPDSTLSLANGDEVWQYRFSSVTLRRDKVARWNDPSRVLRTRGAGETGDYVGVNQESKVGPTGHSSFPGIVNSGPSRSGAAERHINPNKVAVDGYTTQDGREVGGYIRTQGNSTTRDNLRDR